MGSHLSSRGRLTLAAFACSIAALLGGASAASAVQTDQYDPFIDSPSCPTASPYMNGAGVQEVVCVVNQSNQIALKLGNLEIEERSRAEVGFALAPGSSGIEPETCSTPCYRAVPGSTVLEDQPVSVPFPPAGNRKAADQWPGKGSSPLRVSVELAGDLHAFSPEAILGTPVPLFVLPIKLHLEGRMLGDHCYIGSNANPIDFAPFPVSQPEFTLFTDPNGFPVTAFRLGGLTLASPQFSVPAAHGCGPGVGPKKQKVHPLDAVINDVLDLPSPAGQNAMVLSDSSTTLLLAPSGQLAQAAFDAAQQP